jgi:hypothetical protein
LAICSKPFHASRTAGAQPPGPSDADDEGDERRLQTDAPFFTTAERRREALAGFCGRMT